MVVNTVRVDDFQIQEHHLELGYRVDDFKFSTKIYYHDLSFSFLEAKYSRVTIERFTAYIALFDGMKLCSLFPKYYDISEIAKYLSPQVLDLFLKIYFGVSSQHWYENGITNYLPIEIIGLDQMENHDPVPLLQNDRTRTLAACGGGKDSAIVLKMLETAKISFSSVQCAYTTYGQTDIQHRLISRVVNTVNPDRKHLLSIYDDFTPKPFFEIYFPENSGLIMSETQVFVFLSLMLVLAYGYDTLLVANEKSADSGNFFWDKIGREVNHQWCKSLEAELLVDHFTSNVN